MAAMNALHPVQFQHHHQQPSPVMLSAGGAPSQSRPELTDGSGYNAAALWSSTSALKNVSAPANED